MSNDAHTVHGFTSPSTGTNEERSDRSLFSREVAELAAIAASVAANCEPCLKYHYDKARKLGVSKADMNNAAAVALAVKESPARAMVDLVNKLLVERGVADTASTGGCCNPAPADAGDDAGEGCC